jgi:hypothetical protein
VTDRIGERFMRPREFCDYADDLQISDHAHRESLLEFLEKERLLVPAARAIYPDQIVRHFWLQSAMGRMETDFPVERDSERLEAVADLERRLNCWTDPLALTPWLHPLDEPLSQDAQFITREVAAAPFRPWESFRVSMGTIDGHEMREECARTFYHYWQVFMLADIMEMGLQIILDLRDEELRRIIFGHQENSIPKQRQYRYLSVSGLHGLSGFTKHAPSFEALAFFLAYSKRAFLEALYAQKPSSDRLGEEQYSAFSDRKRGIAAEAFRRWSQDAGTFLDFIKWQCQRWNDWDRSGQSHVADEYRRNIAESVGVYQLVTDRDFDQVVVDVPTLDVIFPDWVADQSRAAHLAITSIIAGDLAWLKGTVHEVSRGDCAKFLEWVKAQGMYQFLWFFARLEDLGHRSDPVGLAGLAREVQSLCASFEHLMVGFTPIKKTQRMRKRGRFRRETLTSRLISLWRDVDEINNGLANNIHLTQPQDDLRMQLTQIKGFPGQGAYALILLDLLATVLVRNYGTHLSLQGVSREECFQLLNAVLRSVIVCWKHANLRGFT